MIFHIVEEEKFLNRTIEIFENILPGENIYLIGLNPRKQANKNFRTNNSQNVLYETIATKSYIKIFKEYQNKASLIIFHNLYKQYKLSLGNHIRQDKKIGWMFWGAELYGLNTKINNLLPITERAYYKSLPLNIYFKKKVLSKFKRGRQWNQFKKVLKTNIDYILTNIEDDVTLLNSYAENNTKTIWYTYFNHDDSGIIKDTIVEKKHVLIGNSSSETNNHFDTFELLCEKNLGEKKLYIPLSYGDSHYRHIVKKKAFSLFNNVTPIEDFLSLKEYSSILQSCSVMIMNHKRQQAFNTIMLALLVGCKVFLRDENTLYPYLKREGYIIYSIQDDFNNKDALSPLNKKQQEHNVKLVMKQYSKEIVDAKIKQQILAILNE